MFRVQYGPLNVFPGQATTCNLKASAEKYGALDFHYWSRPGAILIAMTFPTEENAHKFQEENAFDLVVWRLTTEY